MLQDVNEKTDTPTNNANFTLYAILFILTVPFYPVGSSVLYVIIHIQSLYFIQVCKIDIKKGANLSLCLLILVTGAGGTLGTNKYEMIYATA